MVVVVVVGGGGGGLEKMEKKISATCGRKVCG